MNSEIRKGEVQRVPEDEDLSFLPHSANPLLDSLLLFSNKPCFSLLLTCLFVCVTSIHNNIIIRFCLKPLSIHSLALSPSLPFPSSASSAHVGRLG